MRSYFSLLLLILLTTSCGVFLPKLIPAGIPPGSLPTQPAPAVPAPRQPETATPFPATVTPAPTKSSPATPGPALASPDDAVRLVQQKFPELKGIQKRPAGSIGASTDITVQESAGGWNIIFWQGSGDCPAGCINNHYWYVAVEKSGNVMMRGEFVRAFDNGSNSVQTTGAPMWGVPRQ